MAIAAYAASVKVAGTAVAMFGEALSLVSGQTYRVTSSARRVLDPSSAVTVFDSGVPVPSLDRAVDHLFGLVTFAAGYTVTGPVTLSGSYLPFMPVAEVREFSVSVQGTLADSTTLGAAGVALKTQTLKDYTASITALQSALADNDSGGGTVTIAGLHAAGLPVLLEVGLGGYLFRGWALVESFEEKGSGEGLVELSVSLTGTARTSTFGEPVSFGWGA
jgi:hypothetical protein